MIHSGGIGRNEAGMIGTAFFCSYGIGQLFSGFLGDRLNAKYMVFAGLFLSGILNGLMGMANEVLSLSLIWCLNGFSQSLIWSPLIRIVCDMTQGDLQRKLCMYINLSVPLGTMSSYMMSAFVLQHGSWKLNFYIPSICLMTVSFIWLAFMKTIDCKTFSGEMTTTQKPMDYEDNKWFPNWMFILLISLLIQGALKDGVTTWIPTYLEENYQLNSFSALTGTMFIPLCNLLGVTMASIMDRKIGKNEIVTSAVFFGICTSALLVLRGNFGAVISLFMLAIITTSMTSVNTMLIAVLPSRFASIGKTSSISGILNSSVYVGCAVSTYGIGVLSGYWGWSNTISIWIIGALLSFGICIILGKKWSRY